MSRPPGDELRLAKVKANQEAALFRAANPPRKTAGFLLILGWNAFIAGWFLILFTQYMFWGSASVTMGAANFLAGLIAIGYRRD